MIWFINTNESLGENDVGMGGICLSWVDTPGTYWVPTKYLGFFPWTSKVFKYKELTK